MKASGWCHIRGIPPLVGISASHNSALLSKEISVCKRNKALTLHALTVSSVTPLIGYFQCVIGLLPPYHTEPTLKISCECAGAQLSRKSIIECTDVISAAVSFQTIPDSPFFPSSCNMVSCE